MKRFLRFAAIIAGLGAAAWLVRDRLLPAPSPPVGPVPPFRAASPHPAPPSPRPAPPPVEPSPAADDLTEIKGIGPVYAQRLAAAGITSFAGLAAAETAVLATALEVRPEQVASWISQAGSRSESRPDEHP